ncbi:hypothetical protein MnTg02_00112 [bacterium MnTg02]|nr:hypothetical protein MnTg02_00112 [bacterium MnTg02]
MDSIRICNFTSCDQRGHIQIAFRGGRRADANALVGKAHMHGVGVGGRMNGDCGDSQLFTSPLNPEGDFAAICDEDFIKHGERRAPASFNYDQGLAKFDRLAVLDKNGGDSTRFRRGYLVHRFHGFDDE